MTSYPGPERRRVRQPLFPYAAAMRATAVVAFLIGVVVGVLL